MTRPSTQEASTVVFSTYAYGYILCYFLFIGRACARGSMCPIPLE